ncbi:MAG TPA: tetratricopeptide repeat protein [Albitalea sp.]|nr:tetratricopeptide repeat protein [Albitalea sp.]
MTNTIWRLLATLLLAALACAAQAGTKEDIQADIQAGRWSQAETRLQQVLQKHPENALAHYWLAQVKWHQGRPDEAREQLAQAERLDPQHGFAGDKKVLARLEHELGVGGTARPDADASARPAATPREIVPPPAAVAPVERPRSSGGSGLWIVVALVGLVVFIVWAMRAAGRRQRGSTLESLKGQLQEASNDLRDAGKAIDFRSDLSMEQRLALSDRVVRAQGDIASHLATLSERSDFTQSHELLRRVRDIAAEVRGEPRPSDVEAQRALEAQRWQGAPAAMGQPVGGGGVGGVGAALGGLAAGVVIGEMMSGSAHARTAGGDGAGYTRIDQFDPGSASASTSDFDLGGSGGGSWDDGGSDVGGGGGDFD